MLDQIQEGAVWAIFFAPVVSFILIGVIQRSQPRLCGYIGILAVTVSFVLALWVLDSSIQVDGAPLDFPSHSWLSFADVQINVGLTSTA